MTDANYKKFVLPYLARRIRIAVADERGANLTMRETLFVNELLKNFVSTSPSPDSPSADK